MKVSKVVLAASVAGVLSLASLTGTAMAWHPKGGITKKVQNVTASSALSDADTRETGVAAKPGDVLKYVIEVRNDGQPASNNTNDMTNTVMTDTLPDGVALKDNPSKRTITENLGTIAPGQKKTKEYLVVVTTKIAGDITNTACYTGNTKVNDNPQQGCNPAVVTVTVPETPVTPTTPETPKMETPAPEMPAELPHTGIAENVLVSALGLGAAYYAAHRYILSKRELTSALKSVK
jgi:uncharacterized repeat protein (TIGR01451 family)